MPIQSAASDVAMLKTLTGQINATQKELYDLQKKSTADFKHEHYYDMDPILADQSIYVEDLLRKNEMQVKVCDWCTNLLYMQESSIKRFNDIVESGKKLAVQAFNDFGPDCAPDMALATKGILAMVEDELISECFGMNIWNGSRTNEFPFKDNDLINGKVGDNYYAGDNFNLTFFINDSSIEFGDRANLDCFRDLIEGLQIMRDSQDASTNVINQDDLQRASQLLDKAQSGFISLLQKIGNVEQQVVQLKTNAEESLSNLSQMFSESLNGMSEEDRAMNLIDAAAVQRKLGYILPITMKYLNDMSVVKYL
jgi:hypothetical protein